MKGISNLLVDKIDIFQDMFFKNLLTFVKTVKTDEMYNKNNIFSKQNMFLA